MTESSMGPARVLRVQLPGRSYGFLWLLLLSVGILLAIASGFIVPFIVADLILGIENFPERFEVAWMLSVLVCIVLAIIFVCRFVSWFIWRLRVDVKSLRQLRLKRLKVLAEFEQRLPHRAMELAFRSWGGGAAVVNRVFSEIPPNSVVLINPPKPRRISSANLCASFEPIDVHDLRAIGEQLMPQLKIQTFGDESPAPRASRFRDRIRPHRAATRRLRFNLRTLITIVAPLLLVSLIASGHYQLAVASIVLMLIVVAAANELTSEDWWLAPGSLIHRRYSWWSGHTKVHVFSRHNSPLLVFCDAGELSVRNGSQSFGAEVEAVVIGYIVATWLSELQPPTDEAARAFCGVPST